MKIAFGDKARVGKDTAVEYLISNYGGKKFSFAEDLYKILNFAQKTCGFPIEKDRKFLQFIGTDWAREIDPNVWVNLTIQKVNDSNVKNAYVSDVRFRNEFDALKNDGWLMVKIKREIKKESVGGIESHSSENNDIDDCEWDMVIDNNGSFEELKTELDNIVKNVFT